MPHDIFLSYSRADEATMRQVYNHLTQEGFSVWIDEANIIPGTPDWTMAIEEAIEQSHCIVVIFSPSAKKSRWVRAEIQYAEAQSRSIYPILASGNKKDSVPLGHTATQWVDITNKSDISAEMGKLSTVIRSAIDTPFKASDSLTTQAEAAISQEPSARIEIQQPETKLSPVESGDTKSDLHDNSASKDIAMQQESRPEMNPAADIPHSIELHKQLRQSKVSESRNLGNA